MKTIAFLTQKGGSGKTTLTTSLSVAAQQAGEKVLVLDLDPQGSCVQWGSDRGKTEIQIEAVPEDKVSRVDMILKGQGDRFTITFLDTAGADNHATNMVLKAADLILIPIQPTRLDVRAVKPTIQKVFASGKTFAFILNRCNIQPRNTRAFDMLDGLESIGKVARPIILQRSDYQDAYAKGQGVTEFNSKGKAAEEIRGLWEWVQANS